jgi:hypothetical protein
MPTAKRSKLKRYSDTPDPIPNPGLVKKNIVSPCSYVVPHCVNTSRQYQCSASAKGREKEYKIVAHDAVRLPSRILHEI